MNVLLGPRLEEIQTTIKVHTNKNDQRRSAIAATKKRKKKSLHEEAGIMIAINDTGDGLALDLALVATVEAEAGAGAEVTKGIKKGIKIHTTIEQMIVEEEAEVTSDTNRNITIK